MKMNQKKEYLNAHGKRENRKTKERSYSPGAMCVTSAIPSTSFILCGVKLFMCGSPPKAGAPSQAREDKIMTDS